MTDVQAVRATSAFAAARAVIHDTDSATIQDMLDATQIAAPTGAEAERGQWFTRRLAEYGLSARTDEVGNVCAISPAAAADEPWVVIASHLDTVFAAGTPLDVRSDGGRLLAPGISDNSRGLAALLAIARALHVAGWPTRAPIAFVATVGEEGAGDLRGAKHFVARESQRIGTFIALDGAGATRIIHAGVGSRRLRITFRGPGGHSWSDFGNANMIHATSSAIAELAELPLQETPRTTLSVGRMGGGTSVNAIPAETWFELDLRSEALPPLQQLEEAVRDVLRRTVAAQGGAGRGVSCDIEVFGDRPAGATDPQHPLVRLAQDATRALGDVPQLTSSSTDANVPMAAGIPAIAIGAGGDAGGTHTLQEWYENEGGAAGVERALLIAMGAAGLA
jgi:tripeptide aminopeptidase